jgi:hypothetical protein
MPPPLVPLPFPPSSPLQNLMLPPTKFMQPTTAPLPIPSPLLPPPLNLMLPMTKLMNLLPQQLVIFQTNKTIIITPPLQNLMHPLTYMLRMTWRHATSICLTRGGNGLIDFHAAPDGEAIDLLNNGGGNDDDGVDQVNDGGNDMVPELIGNIDLVRDGVLQILLSTQNSCPTITTTTYPSLMIHLMMKMDVDM